MHTLGMRQGRMYETRHTCTTCYLMSGINPASIAARLGHSVYVPLSTFPSGLPRQPTGHRCRG